MPSVVAACVDMGYLRSLSRYLDPYPVLFRGACLCLNNSLTHSSAKTYFVLLSVTCTV